MAEDWNAVDVFERLLIDTCAEHEGRPRFRADCPRCVTAALDAAHTAGRQAGLEEAATLAETRYDEWWAKEYQNAGRSIATVIRARATPARGGSSREYAFCSLDCLARWTGYLGEKP